MVSSRLAELLLSSLSLYIFAEKVLNNKMPDFVLFVIIGLFIKLLIFYVYAINQTFMRNLFVWYGLYENLPFGRNRNKQQNLAHFDNSDS